MNNATLDQNAQVFFFRSLRLKYSLFASILVGVACSTFFFHRLPQQTDLAYVLSLIVTASLVFAAFWTLGLRCAQWRFESGVFKMIYMNGLKKPVTLPMHEIKLIATSSTFRAIHQPTGKFIGVVCKHDLRLGRWEDLLKLTNNRQ